MILSLTIFSFTYDKTNAQNSSAVKLLTEDDLKFLQKEGIELSEFTDEHMRN